MSDAKIREYERDGIVKKTKAPWLGPVVDALNYWNLMEFIRPTLKKLMTLTVGEKMRDLDDLEKMPSPRIMKSHLPFYLLHPELLSTSKVSLD